MLYTKSQQGLNKYTFNHVLTAFSYIKGPIMKDWVNVQDKQLEKSIDSTATNSVLKTDKVLWREFESAFKDTWKDAAKSQGAYDQLMKLNMKDLNIDTYITTFERLASAAEWEADTKGTVTHFQAGLQDNIYQCVIGCENLPMTMAEWKDTARKEVNQTREIISAGLNNFCNKQKPHNPRPFQTSQTSCLHCLITIMAALSQWMLLPQWLSFNSLSRNSQRTK